MKKMIAVVLALCLSAVCLAGCSSQSSSAAESEPAEKKEVIVFAAASMTEALQTIEANYEAEHPDIDIVLSLDSSGILMDQIIEGSPCDLFISAAQKQMNAIDKDCNEDGYDFVVEGTRTDILENKVALAVPAGNPDGVEDFSDMAEGLRAHEYKIAIGDETVPVGQYTQKIFDYYGIDTADLEQADCVTYGTNVKEVTNRVKENPVSCGIIYRTDAYSAELEIIDTATAEMCGQVLYPAAVINTGSAPEEAQAFLDYLATPEATEVFEAIGFSVVAQG